MDKINKIKKHKKIMAKKMNQMQKNKLIVIKYKMKKALIN